MKYRMLVFLLAFMSMLGPLSIDAYLPALPAIAEQFGVKLATAQQSLTIFLFAFAVMSLFHGTLSDSFGRKPVTLGALVVYLLSSIGAGCATSLEMLMIFRLLQGVSAGAGTIISRAIVGDLFKGADARRLMGYMAVVFALAPALAPVVGGWLQATVGWRWIFFTIALFAAVLLIACWRWLPESLPPEQRHAFRFGVIVRHYWEVGRHARFLLRALASAAAFFGVMLYVSSAPAFVINILHLTEKQFAWLFLPLISGLTLGFWISGRLSHRLSASSSITVGYAIMTVAILANVVYTAGGQVKVPWAILPLFGYGMGLSMILSAMSVIMLEMFPHVRGLNSSLQTFISVLIFSVSAGAISPLLFDSAFKMALGMGAGVLLSGILWWLSNRGEEPEKDRDLSFQD